MVLGSLEQRCARDGDNGEGLDTAFPQSLGRPDGGWLRDFNGCCLPGVSLQLSDVVAESLVDPRACRVSSGCRDDRGGDIG
jgi:hypothetical protein